MAASPAGRPPDRPWWPSWRAWLHRLCSPQQSREGGSAPHRSGQTPAGAGAPPAIPPPAPPPGPAAPAAGARQAAATLVADRWGPPAPAGPAPDAFTAAERRRLLFMRWLYRRGELTEFPRQR